MKPKVLKCKVIMNGRVIHDVQYQKYMGATCQCGYFFDEGDYQFKSKTDDFVNYICEKCGDNFKVMIDERVKDNYENNNDLWES